METDSFSTFQSSEGKKLLTDVLMVELITLGTEIQVEHRETSVGLKTDGFFTVRDGFFFLEKMNLFPIEVHRQVNFAYWDFNETNQAKSYE